MTHSADLQSLEGFVEMLYVNYRAAIFSVIARYIGKPSEREDVFHDVFVKILRKAEFLSALPQHKLETYLLLMARGVTIDYLRKNDFYHQSDLPDDMIADLLHARKLRSSDRVDETDKIELSMMLQCIPPEDVTLLIGRYYLNLDSKELAEMCDITPTAVRSRVHRARKRLLEAWKETGLSMGDFIDG